MGARTEIDTGGLDDLMPVTDARDVAYDAMCMWEAVLEALTDESDPLHAALNIERNRIGTAALRDEVLTEAEKANAMWKELPDDHDRKQESFDWEFCPWFLAHHSRWATVKEEA